MLEQVGRANGSVSLYSTRGSSPRQTWRSFADGEKRLTERTPEEARRKGRRRRREGEEGEGGRGRGRGKGREGEGEGEGEGGRGGRREGEGEDGEERGGKERERREEGGGGEMIALGRRNRQSRLVSITSSGELRGQEK
eukprot:345170-Hanusia_phi.AAC.1